MEKPFNLTMTKLNRVRGKLSKNFPPKANRIAKLIDPKTAKEWGLISDFYKDEDLMVEANKLAESIVKQPPDALRMSKKLLREGMGVSFDNILEMSANMQALMHLTDDHQEALSAFFEKRDGDFKGK